MATTITVTATMRISIKCWPFTVGGSWLFGKLARNRINRTVNRIRAALHLSALLFFFFLFFFPNNTRNE